MYMLIKLHHYYSCSVKYYMNLLERGSQYRDMGKEHLVLGLKLISGNI